VNCPLRIWHVGTWCIHLGQKYVESPFEAPVKDVEVIFALAAACFFGVAAVVSVLGVRDLNDLLRRGASTAKE
jgi:hypothetical protein